MGQTRHPEQQIVWAKRISTTSLHPFKCCLLFSLFLFVYTYPWLLFFRALWSDIVMKVPSPAWWMVLKNVYFVSCQWIQCLTVVKLLLRWISKLNDNAAAGNIMWHTARGSCRYETLKSNKDHLRRDRLQRYPNAIMRSVHNSGENDNADHDQSCLGSYVQQS